VDADEIFDRTQVRELDARARSAAAVLAIAATVIYPAWSQFDYLIAPGLWVRFAAMRFLLAALVLLVYFVWRRRRVSTEALVYVAFLGMAIEIAYMCAIVDVGALLPYFLGFSTLFVAVGIIVLWRAVHSIVVLLAALVALMIFNGIFYERPLTVLVQRGAFVFVTLAVVSIILTQMRFRMVRDEISARLRVEAAHEKLEEQAAELASSNRELARFARVVSHDLKTPMNRLSLAVDVLEDPTLQEEDRQLALHSIRDALGFASRTVDELLVAARAGRRDAAKEREAVDLAALYAELEPELREELRRSSGRVITRFDDCPSVVIDRAKLKSILQNLLTNAIKFRAEERPPEIRVTSHTSGSFAVLAVADNGLGMELDDEAAGAAALPLRRQRPEIQGSGLGLGLVKDIVESEGGRIEIESELGRGSTFRVWLPDPKASERQAGEL
jgi:signal transduction histidine kinase